MNATLFQTRPNTKIVQAACTIALSIGFASMAHAATTQTSGSFSEVVLESFYYNPGDVVVGQLEVERSAIVGLEQFDPALGTLTGVTLSTNNFVVDVTAGIEVYESTDPELEHTAQVNYVTDGFGQGVASVISYFTTSTSTNSLAFAEIDFGVSCTGLEFSSLGPCFASEMDSYNFNDNSSIVGDTLTQIGLVNLLGTGALTGLTVGAIHPLGSNWFTDNIGEEDAEAIYETIIRAGTVTLTYEYTAVVPIPAAAWLFGSALLGLGVVKRKKA